MIFKWQELNRNRFDKLGWPSPYEISGGFLMQLARTARWFLLALLLSVVPATSFAGVFISVGIAPPVLPVYEPVSYTHLTGLCSIRITLLTTAGRKGFITIRRPANGALRMRGTHRRRSIKRSTRLPPGRTKPPMPKQTVASRERWQRQGL